MVDGMYRSHAQQKFIPDHVQNRLLVYRIEGILTVHLDLELEGIDSGGNQWHQIVAQSYLSKIRNISSIIVRIMMIEHINYLHNDHYFHVN